MQKKIKSERLKTTLNALVIITSTFIILIFIWRYEVKNCRLNVGLADLDVKIHKKSYA